MLRAFKEEVYKSDLLLFILLASCVVLGALLRPVIPWDTVAYHLPFGAKLVHLAKAEDFSLYSKYYEKILENRFLGIPLFPYYIHGYLYKLFGSMRFLTLISAIPLIFLAQSVKTLFDMKRGLFLCLCLAVPIVSIHSHSSYIDMLSATLVASLAFITIKSMEPGLEFKNRVYLAVVFAFLSFLCGQTRYFAAPFIYPLALVCVWVFISHCVNGRQKAILAAIFFVAVFAGSLKFAVNLVQYHNPFYPIGTMMFNGPEPAWSTDPGYLSFLGPLARPIYFFLSITELDLLIRGITPLYSVGSSGASDAILTGGFGFIGVISFLGWQVFYFLKSKSKDIRVINTIKVIAIMLILNAFMPQAHVLRYWMYIPFLFALLALFQLNAFDIKIKHIFIPAAIAIAIINQFYIVDYHRLFGQRLDNIPGYPVQQIVQNNSEYVCTGDNIYFPFLLSTVMNEGNWKTNVPECFEENNACKTYVNWVGKELVFKPIGCTNVNK